MTCEERLTELEVRMDGLPTIKGYLQQERGGREIDGIMAINAAEAWAEGITDIRALVYYILYLTDLIDRTETRLDNIVTFQRRITDAISNAEIPDGVPYEQFCLVIDKVFKAIQSEMEGWVQDDGQID